MTDTPVDQDIVDIIDDPVTTKSCTCCSRSRSAPTPKNVVILPTRDQ